MMQFIREKAQGIFAWVMLVLVGIPFALWGINNYIDDGKETPVASVGDRDFYDRDLNRAYEQDMANLVGLGEIDEAMIRKQALERLIRDEVIAQTADHERLVASDDGVRTFVQGLPYFQTDGKFDKDKYTMMLSAQGMTAPQFLAQVRRALIMEQFQQGITDTALVSDAEINQFLQLQHQQRQVETLTLPQNSKPALIEPTAVEAYFKAHAAEFMDPERVSVDYVTLRLDAIAAKLDVSDEDLHRYYDEQKSSYTTEERRKVSHILFAADAAKPESLQAAKARAEAAAERLQKGEDFAVLAKAVSDDKPSAAKGGDLGVLVKGAMEPVFDQAAAALAEGGVSPPVQTTFGYHLIKVTALEPGSVKPFAAVKTELAEAYRHNAAESQFYEAAQKMSELAFEHPDSLDAVASALGLSIAHSVLFDRGQGQDIAAEEAIRKAAFSEEVLNGKNSEPVEIGNDRVLLLHLNQHLQPAAQPLDGIRRAIVTTILQQEAAQAASRQAVEAVLAAVREGKSLAEVAKAGKYSYAAPVQWQRDTQKIPAPLLQAAFVGYEEGRLGAVALESGDQVVYRVISISAPEAATFKPEEIAKARRFLARGQGQKEFGAYMTALRENADVDVRASKEK